MTGGLHQVLVRARPVLIQQTVESLLVDAGLRELHLKYSAVIGCQEECCLLIGCYLGVFPVRGVHDGCAANFCDFLAVSVKTPATNLVAANHILDEQHSVTEPENQRKEMLSRPSLWMVNLCFEEQKSSDI